MNKLNISIIILLISVKFFGQTTLNENEIIGKWKVVDAKITMKDGNSNENILKAKEGFIKSIFHFNGNGIFNIKFKKDVPWFFKELKTMSNNNWIYEQSSKLIKVGTKEDNYTIMEVSPFKNKNKFFFGIVGFIFEVERISKGEKTSFVAVKKEKKETTQIENSILKKQNIKTSEIYDYQIVEKTPTISKCKSKNEEKMKKCFKKEIYKHFIKKFSSTLPAELGLSAGTQKITNTFIINKNGEVVNIESFGKSPELNRECKRVISLLPKMKPGIHKGEIVNVKYELPFTIRVE